MAASRCGSPVQVYHAAIAALVTHDVRRCVRRVLCRWALPLSRRRRLYARPTDQPLPVSRATGALLYMLARSIGAQNVAEFGASFGISTLHLAAALRDNGGGRLIGSEFEPSKAARARENLAAAHLSDLVDIREGDALETFARDLPRSIDLVLLDEAKDPFYRARLSFGPLCRRR